MKIYTKQGDKGKTSIYTKEVLKVDKDDLILECYGSLDELNSYLGLICAQVNSTFGPRDSNVMTINEKHISIVNIIQKCQQQLFNIGFAISDSDKLQDSSLTLLEEQIDAMQTELAPQNSFILPGGSLISSYAHVARTVARRAERRLVALSKEHAINPLALSYINRLSDYLFVLARYYNKQQSIQDIQI